MKKEILNTEQQKLIVENCISYMLFTKESPKRSSFSYKGNIGSCFYCGEDGKTHLKNDLETSVMCDKCYYRECVIDD